MWERNPVTRTNTDLRVQCAYIHKHKWETQPPQIYDNDYSDEFVSAASGVTDKLKNKIW